MKTQQINLVARAGATMVRLEMYTLEEYCETGNLTFKRRMHNLEKDVKENPAGYDDDQLVDLREQLRIHTQYNSYFGELMSFAALERYFKSLYDHTRRLATVPEMRKVIFEPGQRWLTFDQYKDFFNRLEIKLSSPPYEWAELKRLQAFRNAIAHQGGSVTSENIKALEQYKYKLGDSLDISIKQVKQDIQRVMKTADTVAKDFTVALEKLNKSKPKPKS